MGILDDLFGGVFDLNGDGHTDAGEEFMAYLLLNDSEDDSDDGLF